LKSETAGGVAGRSTTNFVDDNHVSNKNSNRHDYEQYDNVNSIDHVDHTQIKTRAVGSFGDQHDQCQTNDDFLRPGRRTQPFCLLTFIISFKLSWTRWISE